MGPIAATLAAALAALALTACDGRDGPEPEPAPSATIALGSLPGASAAPLYGAETAGRFTDEGVEVEIGRPRGSSGAAQLASGRADLAVLDINDLAAARERGEELVAVAALAQRPLASVLSTDPAISAPGDLAGARVGVGRAAWSRAALGGVLAAAGLTPKAASPVAIGPSPVHALEAGRLGAAAGLWSTDAVELRLRGVPVREFRLDELGAPRYPELVLAARGSGRPAEPGVVCPLLEGISRGFDDMERDPEATLAAMLAERGAGEHASLRAQYAELIAGDAFSPVEDGRADPALRADSVAAWANWARELGLLAGGGVREGFAPDQIRDCALHPPGT